MTMTEFQKKQLKQMRVANRARRGGLLFKGILALGVGLYLLQILDAFGQFPSDSLLHRAAQQVTALEEQLIQLK